MKSEAGSLKQLFIHTGEITISLAVVLYGFFFLVLPHLTNKGQIVSVPHLNRLPLRDAIAVLEERGLAYEVTDSAYDGSVQPLTVLQQFPKPLADVKVFRKIQLVLNARRPPNVSYPDLAGADLEFAKRQLELLGLNVGNIEFVPDIAHGAVLASLFQEKIVKPGAEIPKRATIDLVIGMKEGNLSASAADEKILYQKTIDHVFSDPNQNDSFELTLSGNSILEGTIAFRIITAKGQVILSESYPAAYFLDYGLGADASDDQKEKYIRKRMDAFFDEENFYSPAVGKDEKLDEDYSQKSIWEDIQSDETAIGFHYLIGEEDARNIAYSKSSKKVVSFFSCC